MKRIVICVALLLGAIAASFYAHFRVAELNGAINMRIDALAEALHEGDSEKIIEQTYSFADFWNTEEKNLVRFVRHSHIDIISISVARLPALTEYGEYSEAYAELMSIRRQMEHILASERLTFSNLL